MKHIFSMKMAVLMLFVFGVVAGVATFIENDYGTQTAKALVYKAVWFEVFLAYFIAILIYNIVKYKSYKTKPAIFLFHFSFIVMAIGAIMTRYIGYEGIMHIREGSSSNTMVSDAKILQFKVTKSDQTISFEKELYLSSMTSNSLNKTLTIKDKEVKLELVKYLPTFHKEVVSSKDGKEILELKISSDKTGAKGKTYIFFKGERKDFGNVYIAYEANITEDKPTFLISEKDNKLSVNFPFSIQTLNMNDKNSSRLEAGDNKFQDRMLYRFGGNAVVLKQFLKKAKIEIDSHDIKTQRGQREYLVWKVSIGDKSQLITTKPYNGKVGKVHKIQLDGVDIELSVGAKVIDIPFSVKLIDFELERYPGSMTPASYASDVVLIDQEQGVNMEYRIYMNHILDHRSYRFFQSSYDKDEKGTILSVNHDPGTWPTYIGYILLTLGMIWSLFVKNGRFQQLLRGARKLQTVAPIVIVMALLAFNPQNSYAASEIDKERLKTLHSYDLEHSRNFGKLVTQDYQGRMKPVDTIAHEIISKITGKSSIFNLEPTQMLLGMILQPSLYQNLPMIKIGHQKIALQLDLKEDAKYASYSDFFDKKSNSYKIFKDVTESSRKKPLEKSQYDKELIKIDERVNVAFIAYRGSLLRIYPKPNDTNNKWFAPMEALKTFPRKYSQEVKIATSAYFQMVTKGLKSGDWKDADTALKGIHQMQNKYGSAVIPTPTRIDMEIKYNEFGLFSKLVPLYLLLGIILLIFAFIHVVKPTFSMKWIMRGAWTILIIGFIIHMIGLAIRWYIADHAPWSNAYESIVFIAVSTVFAGIVLAKKSPFALAGTALLAGITMGVAHMNFINPEITNLVPVLKSYWLMIHVATIISGDGFLGFGSILSLLVIILYIMRGKNGTPNIDRSIKELTNLSEMALIIGLFLVTIGNFLGGVWANESWGRYWGWDAKETWAAVTILIYATVLHLRFIPALKSNFIYNISSAWAYSTVLMTYFGVNYYLSGLHSYAAGDPVPIPLWVYYTIAGLFVLTLIASRNRKLK